MRHVVSSAPQGSVRHQLIIVFVRGTHGWRGILERDMRVTESHADAIPFIVPPSLPLSSPSLEPLTLESSLEPS